MNLYIQENILKLYAGFKVSNVNVCQNGSQLRYTYKMTPGQTLDIILYRDEPLIFTVTGHAINENEDFEYTFSF